MKQQRVKPPRRKTAPEVVEELDIEEPDADLLSDIDELLDEIDAVLEDQAVLAAYRQRSGQ
jgi:hypothetical protein